MLSPGDLTAEEKRQLARKAGGKRRQGRHAEADEIQRDLAVDTLADHIRQVVYSVPAPRPDQIERLRALLPPVPADRPHGTEAKAA